MIRLQNFIEGLPFWLRCLLAGILGASAGLALPPYDIWLLWFGVVPLFLTLASPLQSRGCGRSFLLGWALGLGYFVVTLHWIGYAFLVDQTYLWMMPFAVGGLALFMAVYWGLAVMICLRLSRPGLGRVFWLAGMIGLAEFLRGRLFTGFPWAAPGLSVDGMGAVAQGTALIGMEGMSVVILLWAGAWPFLLKRPRDGANFWLALVVVMSLPLLWGWGKWRLETHPLTTVADVRLRIVQPNISQNDKWRGDNMATIFEQLLEMSAKPVQSGAPISHIIMPEAAIPFLIDESEASRARLAKVLAPGQLVIAGALRRSPDPAGGEDRIYNSVLIFSNKGDVLGAYDKRHLVPGGEFLPFEWLLQPLGFRRLVELPGSFAVGTGPQVLRLPPAPPAGFSICYEAIFPAHLAGAERPAWLINVTNDGWFGTSSGPYQHLAQARLRSIEQGLPMARAANTGISAIIDSYGRTVAQTALMVSAVIDGPLPQAAPQTLYALAPSPISLVVVFLILSIGLATTYTVRV